MSDTDMLYMASLEKRNEELEAKVAELEEKHWNECRQIAHYSDELKEAKRLLKSSTGIIKDVDCNEDYLCDECEYRAKCDGGFSFYWRYADEALALIGEDTNVGGKIDSWISREDRLPSENTLVLCYARSTTGEGNGYFLGGLALGEFWFLKVNDIGHVSYPVPHWEVTHWQPLPEPPKE